MFTHLCKRFCELLSPRGDRERDAYLAQSSDLADLERRMRHVDRSGYPFGIYSGGIRHDTGPGRNFSHPC